MRIVASLVSLLVSIDFLDNLILSEAMHFNVTSMKGAEDVYFRIKRRKPSLRPPKEEKLQKKENICMAILGTDVFDRHTVELVNPNHHTIHDHVKQHHPNIHDQHYRPNEGNKPKFANPYRVRDISVQGKVIREYVFTCLTRNSSTRNIERFFVSQEYEANGSSKMVRFVFACNEKTNEITVVAMAERNSIAHEVHAGTTPKAANTKKDVSESEVESSYEDEEEEEKEQEEQEEEEKEEEEEEGDESNESW